MSQETMRELEPWEVVFAENFSSVQQALKKVQYLTQLREAKRARNAMIYPLQSIEGYFEHLNERIMWALEHVEK